jgi:hypothetical protein
MVVGRALRLALTGGWRRGLARERAAPGRYVVSVRPYDPWTFGTVAALDGDGRRRSAPPAARAAHVDPPRRCARTDPRPPRVLLLLSFVPAAWGRTAGARADRPAEASSRLPRRRSRACRSRVGRAAPRPRSSSADCRNSPLCCTNVASWFRHDHRCRRCAPIAGRHRSRQSSLELMSLFTVLTSGPCIDLAERDVTVGRFGGDVSRSTRDPIPRASSR